jgi:hypothetical protein
LNDLFDMRPLPLCAADYQTTGLVIVPGNLVQLL